MINTMLFLSSHTIYGGGIIGNMLAQWEQAGFFSFLLPFLLIFALIFGILSRADIFKGHRAVNGIIAVVVALLALQFDIVPRFFSEIFPRLGVGLAILLIAMILVGMFMTSSMTGILFGIGAIIFLVVLINTAGVLGWSSAFWWEDNWPHLVVAILVIAGIVGIWRSGMVSETPKELKYDAPFARSIGGR